MRPEEDDGKVESGRSALEEWRRGRALIVACLVAFLQFVGAYMRIPLVPLYARAHGATPADVGRIVALFMLTAAVVALPVGFVSDRVGRRLVIAAGVGIGLLVSALLPITVSLGGLMALYAMAGVGVAGFTPGMMAYIGDVAGSGMMGQAYGWYTTAQYAGMAVGPALGGLTADRGGFAGAFLGSALVLALALGGILLGLPSTGQTGTGRAGREVGAALSLLMRNPTVLACWGTVFACTFAWGASLSFFPLYAQEAGVGTAAMGLCFTAQAVANAVGRAPIGRLLDRTGRRAPFIAGGMMAFGVTIAGTILLTRPLSLALLSALQGLSMGTAMVAVGAALSEASLPENRGIAMGGYGTAIYAGLATSAWLLGHLISLAGFPAGFLVAGSFGVAGAGASLFLRKG